MELISPPVSGRTAIPDQFERTVLTFLVERRQTLGVARVFQAENLLVDGALTLEDGRFLAVEIKYRMNWLKTCQSGWQFGQFTRMPEACAYRPVPLPCPINSSPPCSRHRCKSPGRRQHATFSDLLHLARPDRASTSWLRPLSAATSSWPWSV